MHSNRPSEGRNGKTAATCGGSKLSYIPAMENLASGTCGVLGLLEMVFNACFALFFCLSVCLAKGDLGIVAIAVSVECL